ncbi:hypothetical protein M8494_35355 [Serratia ureilytica]
MRVRHQIRRSLFPWRADLRHDYDQRAQELAQTLGIEVSIPRRFAGGGDRAGGCILVSGGNNGLLNQMLHEQGLIVPIQRAVREREVPLRRLERRLQRGHAEHSHHQ